MTSLSHDTFTWFVFWFVFFIKCKMQNYWCLVRGEEGRQKNPSVEVIAQGGHVFTAVEEIMGQKWGGKGELNLLLPLPPSPGHVGS